MRIFEKLRGKKLIWTKYVRVFCDGGNPKNLIWPRFHFGMYDPCWKMKGGVLTWLGRQFFFSFGEDKKGFYK